MTGRHTETLTFHFDLGSCPQEENFSLGVLGKRHALQPHTPETRERLSRTNQALALMSPERRENLTHFVEHVEMAADAVGLHMVTYPSRVAGSIPLLALPFVHVPTAAKRRYFRTSAPGSRSPSAHPSALDHLGISLAGLSADEAVAAKIDATQAITPGQAAETLLFSHPDVISLRQDIAASVLHGHIARALKADPRLVEYISLNGPGTATPYSAVQTVVNPRTNVPFTPITVDEAGHPILAKDGKPLVWPTGADGQNIIQEYSLSQGVLDAATGVLGTIIRSVKMDPALNGQKWTKQHGITAVARKRTTTAPLVAPVSPARLDASSGRTMGAAAPIFTWTLSSQTSMYGLNLHGDSIAFDPITRTLSFDVQNWANRCLSAWVDYYDETGASLGDPHYLAIITPGNTMAGIPTWTGASTLKMVVPDDAVKADVLLGGLGIGNCNTAVNKGGIATTAIFNYAIPLFLLGLSVGSTAGTTVTTLITGVNLPFLVAVVEDSISDSPFDARSLISIFGEVGIGLLFSAVLARTVVWLTGYATAEEAAEAIPIVGWAIKIVNCATAAADMAATTAEVLQSPATFRIEASRVIDVQVDVAPDPTHGTQGQAPIWPREADHWEVTVQYKGGTTVRQSGTMTAVMPDKHLSVSFSGDTAISAAPGAQIQVCANFYSATNWLCGKWSSGWIAAIAPDGLTTLTLDAAIIEFLVPLTGDTVYSHDQKLAFRDGHHLWVAGTTPPAALRDALYCADIGNVICRLVNMTLNDLDYTLGYTFQAAGQGMPLDFQNGKQSGQMFAFQSISILGDAEVGMKFPTIGFSRQPFLAFDQFGPAPLFSMESARYQPELDAADGAAVPADIAALFAGASGATGKTPTAGGNYALPVGSTVKLITATAEWLVGTPGTSQYTLKRETDTIAVFRYPDPAFSPRNFYLDPRVSSAGDVDAYLRQVKLDGRADSFDYTPGQSWGAFPNVRLDAVAIHPNGYAIGIIFKDHKLMVLHLADTPVADADAPVALALSGKGVREGLLGGPIALTVTADGRILILEQDNMRVQAFDTMGNPVHCFVGPLAFPLDGRFKADLNDKTPSDALRQAFQKSIQPQLVASFSLPLTMAAALDRGTVGDDLRQQFKAQGYALSETGPFRLMTTVPGTMWLLIDQATGLSYDLRAALYVSRGRNQLFTLPASLAMALDAGTATQALRQAFADGGATLSPADQLRVVSVTSGAEWLLIDSGTTPNASYDISVEARTYVYRGAQLLFILPAGIAGELAVGAPPQDLLDTFAANGITLSGTLAVQKGADGLGWRLVDSGSGSTYDIDLEADIDVFHAPALTVEVVAENAHWILRDTTNTLTFDLKANADLEAQQLISTMALKDGAAPKTYLDIAAETKGFIYVLSYGGTGSSASDYHLDLYHPDGRWLARTPRNPGDPGVNGARMAVDQWRNLYTLNYEQMLGPGGRTEPTVSIWIPSTPAN